VSEKHGRKKVSAGVAIKLHGRSGEGDAKGRQEFERAGVYISRRRVAGIGSPVEFEDYTAAGCDGRQENVVIQCKGRVVRTDPTGASAMVRCGLAYRLVRVREELVI